MRTALSFPMRLLCGAGAFIKARVHTDITQADEAPRQHRLGSRSGSVSLTLTGTVTAPSSSSCTPTEEITFSKHH